MKKAMPLDLSSYRLPKEKIDLLKEKCRYQPFVLPDGSRTGVAMGQLGLGSVRLMEATLQGTEEYIKFCRENDNLAGMYEDIIAGIKVHCSGLSGKVFADVACNAGYFCYRALQEGAKAAHGYDRADYSEVFRIVNECLSLNAEFTQVKYDMRKHCIDAFPEADVVLSTAFICHSSDPSFLIDFLAKKAKKAVVLFSKFPKSSEYFIKFSNVINKYGKRPYPLCFDGCTEVSDSLLELALKENGFDRVVELERQDTWLPRGDSWRCFIGIR